MTGWPAEAASLTFPIASAAIDDFVTALGSMPLVVGAVVSLRQAPTKRMSRRAPRGVRAQVTDVGRWTGMEWTPIDREELQHWIERGLKAGGDGVRAFFAKIAREPIKWQLHPWGDRGGGFWIVAVLGSRAVILPRKSGHPLKEPSGSARQGIQGHVPQKAHA